jgi:hypothetical protein
MSGQAGTSIYFSAPSKEGRSEPDTDPGPTVPGAIAAHRRLVAACTVLIALLAMAYSLHQPKVFQAHASMAIAQPTQSQPVASASGSPQQYVESQVLLLQSPAVADRAVTIANAALGRATFVRSDFNGSTSSLKVISQTATDPNSSVVNISFSADTAADAAVGANAILKAYTDVRVAQIEKSDSALISAIDSTVTNIDAQLADLSGHGSTVNTELATSLVDERSNLLQQRSAALIDEHVNGSQAPSVVPAFVPSQAANHKLTKTGPIGAVLGFILGTVVAYRLEIRRPRPDTGNVGSVPHPVEVPATLRAWNPVERSTEVDSDSGQGRARPSNGSEPDHDGSPAAFVARRAIAIYRSRLTELERSLPAEPRIPRAPERTE